MSHYFRFKMMSHNAYRGGHCSKMADVAAACTFFLLMLFFLSCSFAAKEKKDIKKKTGKGNEKIGKNILDYNEVDMERLLDQWDVSIHNRKLKLSC